MNAEGTINLPHSPEAEEAVIGSVLLNPPILPELRTRVQPGEFFLAKNLNWLEAMIALYERQEVIDVLTLTAELKRRGQWDEAVDLPRLNFIQFHMPTSLHAQVYADIVHRMYVRRQLMQVASKILQHGYQENIEIPDMLADSHALLMELIAAEGKTFGATSKELASADWDEWEKRQAQGGGMLGYSTGSPDLDRLIGGLNPSRLTIIGGRPKMGKTAAQLMLMLSVARELAPVSGGEWVYMFSLEMSEKDITKRLLAAISGINLEKLMLGKLNDEESAVYAAAVSEYARLRIFIDDSAGLSVKDIEDRMAVNVLRFGPPALIAVDYMQIVRGGRSKNYNADNRPVEVEDAAYGLAELAKKLNCHVVAGAQIKQEVEQRKDKRGGASDFANSDGILRAADHAVTIYRDRVYNDSAPADSLEWLLVGNRHGETAIIKDMQWNKLTASMSRKQAKQAPVNLFGESD